MRVETKCPAKINTFLAVGPKDSVGYHPLRTRFLAVDLCDVLSIERADEDEFICDWPQIPVANTVQKAWNLVKEIAMMPKVRITLKKRIPIQSGLGGGSSDAAGFLRLVDRFLPAPLGEGYKRDIAAAVGADVPFFLVGGYAEAEGYGEKVTPLPDYPATWFVILKPNIGVSTPEAFAKLDSKSYLWRSFPETHTEFYNDFERTMPCECDDYSERLIVRGASHAQLTGSGSALFGVFETELQATEAAALLSEELKMPLCNRQVDCNQSYGLWVVRSLSRSESLA